MFSILLPAPKALSKQESNSKLPIKMSKKEYVTHKYFSYFIKSMDNEVVWSYRLTCSEKAKKLLYTGYICFDVGPKHRFWINF